MKDLQSDVMLPTFFDSIGVLKIDLLCLVKKNGGIHFYVTEFRLLSGFMSKTKTLLSTCLLLSVSLTVCSQSMIGLGVGLQGIKHQDLSISPLLSKGSGLSLSLFFQRENRNHHFLTSLSFANDEITSSARNVSGFTSVFIDARYYRSIGRFSKSMSFFAGGFLPVSFFQQDLSIQSSLAGSSNNALSGLASLGLGPAFEVRKSSKKGWFWVTHNFVLVSVVIRPGYNQSPPASVTSDEAKISEILTSATLAGPSSHFYGNLHLGYHRQLSHRSAFELSFRCAYQKANLPLAAQGVRSFTNTFVLSYHYCFRQKKDEE
jgi:hypothetical protein